MDLKFIEKCWLISSSIIVFGFCYSFSLFLAFAYALLLSSIGIGLVKLQPVPNMFWRSSLSIANVFLFIALWLGGRAFGQSSTIFGTETVDTLSTAGPSATVAPSGTNTETFRPLFTIPTNADNGAIVIPNIADPEAVDAQTVCPGYTASDVQRSQFGLTATLTLAGEACNVYGNDVDRLTLTVQYQSPDRLSVKIQPSNLSPQNTSWFILPESLVPSPQLDANANSTVEDNELEFFWDNDPSFSFSVIRKSTDDVLFSTAGTKLVYEDQFLEFVSTLPDNYNLYGLGETIHGLRLGNNFTKVSSLRSCQTSLMLSDYLRC